MPENTLPLNRSAETLKEHLAELEQFTGTPVLLLSASMLDIDILPTLYRALQKRGMSGELSVVLFGRGGDINSIRRLALLLRQYCQHLTFIVPHYCQSACTALSLAGDRIIGGSVSIFSPIDTRLNLDSDTQGGCLQAEDLRLFSKMATEWFGVPPEERYQILPSVMESIFPTTLSSLYRSQLEIYAIADEMLSMGAGKQLSELDRKAVAKKLIEGYHSHSYALTIDDLAAMKLPASSQTDVYESSWRLAIDLQSCLGGAARECPEDPRCDVILGFSDDLSARLHFPQTFAPKWQSISGSE